jgi:hypothetical protein
MYLGMRIVWGQRVMWEMVIRVDFDMSAVPVANQIRIYGDAELAASTAGRLNSNP